MYRGPLVFAALIGSASADCASCNIDLTALEEFTSDYDVVMAMPAGQSAITTMSLPPTMPSDHGTVAVHARNVQLKLDNHFAIPADFQFPGRPNPILAQLPGHEIQEELHINGAHGQASFHLASPILNACIQVDVPAPPINHDMMDMQLQQAQQIATMQAQHRGQIVEVDGDQCVGLPGGRPGGPPFPIFAFDADSHPDVVVLGPAGPPQGGPPPMVALKFSNYVDSVGDAFAVRACEVESHSATQTMLAENPEVREFFANRLAEHQRRLQALLEPSQLNTRFNFVPLQVADLLLAPAHEGCANDALAETAPMAVSTFQSLVVCACSFAMGVAATYGALRRKKATPSDALLYQVSA
jgi:hypothetical protein